MDFLFDAKSAVPIRSSNFLAHLEILSVLFAERFLWVTAMRELASQNNLFRPNLAIPRLDVQNRDQAIESLCHIIAASLEWNEDQCQDFFNRVIRREGLGSTGIGRGWAVPHAAVEWIEKPYVVTTMVPNGIDFNSLDNKPVRTIVMIASSSGCPGDLLRLLESIGRCIGLIGLLGQ